MPDTDWGKMIVDTIVQAGKEGIEMEEVTRNFTDLDDEQMLEEAKWTGERLQQVHDELKERGMKLTVAQWGSRLNIRVKRTVLEV